MVFNHELARGWICSLSKMVDLCSQNPRGPYLQLVKYVDFRCNVLNVYIYRRVDLKTREGEGRR
jgi:hypothetical protein